MNNLVKILRSDNGDKIDNPKWCLIHTHNGENATLCSAEYFEMGESRCEYKTKQTKRGGITCKDCLEEIKIIKAVKL